MVVPDVSAGGAGSFFEVKTLVYLAVDFQAEGFSGGRHELPESPGSRYAGGITEGGFGYGQVLEVVREALLGQDAFDGGEEAGYPFEQQQGGAVEVSGCGAVRHRGARGHRSYQRE